MGELYLGGAGVARAYLHRAELTADRFLDDPVSPLPGARMYRTGGLARYENDGSPVWEIFCSLQCGAQLALASDADVKDPQRMADLVTREEVTIAQYVPSTLAPFLATQSPDNASPLRLVIFGGEALTPEHLKQCQSVLPRVAFRNMYGSTEAAIDALFWPCPDNYDSSQIAIGRPMN